MKEFHSLIVSNEPQFKVELKNFTAAELPQGEVTLRIAYSSINYKDALALTEKGGVLRSYPMIPGIDASGVVVESKDDRFCPGDKVIITSYGFGVSRPGGYSELQRVPADWLVKLPQNLTLKESMALGTAGFTAALSVQAIEEAGATPDSRVLITGASGGVGSTALAMLHQLGYTCLSAVSRKPEAREELTKLGADQIISPVELLPEKVKPLAKQQYDYVIDTVGGKLLAAILPMVCYGGAAALCGNAGGIQLNTTVLPFILRGVKLLGIDSVNTPMAQRIKLWQRLATDLNVSSQIKVQEVLLEEVPAIAQTLLEGTHTGRTIVKIDKDLDEDK